MCWILGGYSMEKLSEIKINGIKLPYFAALAVVLLASMYLGGLGNDFLSTIAYLMVLGGICIAVGDRIPVFNKWVGGGSLLAVMFPSWMNYMHLIPEKYVESATTLFDTAGYQTFFICMLMASSLLVLERKALIQSLIRYIPVVLVGVATAGVFGTFAGVLMGYRVSDLLVMYVLPVMGGGNGAGAIPMSQIYEQVTGGDKDAYYSVALAILTLANTICIVVAAILNGIGSKIPSWTGDKKTLMRKENAQAAKEKEVEFVKPSMDEIAASFIWVGAIFALSLMLAKKWLPTIGGIPIHQYAYFVVLLAICNIFDIIPQEFKNGIKVLSNFCVRSLGAFGFAAVGIVMTDFGEFMNAISLKNGIICFAIVLGAVIGTAVFGWILGFYPIDSAITAGLCMANRGGGGDLIVLSAADRLELMSYAAVSSRLGGGLVLVLAGIVFSILY